LIEGHFYQARLKRIDGGDITGLGLSLYKPGSASSVGKSYRLGNMFIKEYIADSTDYHVALTIKREDTPRAFANLELVFELIDLTERSLLGAQERIFTIWNNRIGSIYVDGDDLVISKDGFCIKYLEQPYYIAPTDRETITRISGTRGDVRILLIDTTKLINPGGRQEPSDVLSIVDGSPYRYNINFIPMAIWYKSYWDFISPFDYFNEQNMINKIVKNHVQINSSLVQNNIISHRGTSGTSEYDDNTLQAFEEAINIKGYKIVECDTRFTSDNVIILSHDASISSGGNSYIIADNTYSYLKSVYPSLTTLNELLLLCKKKNACCEIDMKIQNEDSVTSHYELVRKMNMLGSTVFTCTKDIASIFIELGKNAIFSVTQINSVELAREVSHIAELSLLCICSTPKANITRELIETIHEIGAFSKIWTVDSLTEANSFFDDGGDLIITNSILPSQIE
jgi:glycerophosphoryl diester phosphodiesterase